MKRTTLFRILTVVYLVAVAVLCFANFGSEREMPLSILGIPTDKIAHFLMFLPFPVVAFFSFPLKKAGVLKSILLIVAMFVVGCLLAWGTEYVQSKLPYRTMDPADFKADGLGLICGSVGTFLIRLFSKK
ncbi:MAG: VanZ family protein [Bacteroidales bacterium]|nr:VanZ family protein [Bacteroidales bacterium]